jgi:hypothetical protein
MTRRHEALRNAVATVLVLLVALPEAAVAQQGVGPSRGPFEAGLPPADADRPWFLEFDLKAALAPGDADKSIGLNLLPISADDDRALGARYLFDGTLVGGRRFDTPVIEGVFAFVEFASGNGRNIPGGDSSWGLGQVAWVRYAGAGLLLPRAWWVYVEGQGHWTFSEGELGGPYEIYNMFVVGKGLDVEFGPSNQWFFDGYLEGGISWSHNEVSVNLRRFDQPETEFFGDSYGRYAIRGTLKLGRQIEAGPVRRASIYWNPYFIFGRTIPQQEYTWAADYIGSRRNIGAELIFGDDWRVFAEYQWNWDLSDKQGVPGTGPYESYFALGVMKSLVLRF